MTSRTRCTAGPVRFKTKKKAACLEQKTRRRFPRGGFFEFDHRDEKTSVLGRPGSDLLFQALRLSTIGAEEFNGRVRYGNGFRPLARTTRSAKDGFLQARAERASRT